MNKECPRCARLIPVLELQCGGCGADLGSELEIAAFHTPAIDSARRMILFAGFFYPLVPIIVFAMLARFVGFSIFASSAFLIMLAAGCGLLLGHLALWKWAKKAPLPATTLALLIYLGYVGYTGVTTGWLIKLIGLVILLRGVLAATHVHKIRRRLASTLGNANGA